MGLVRVSAPPPALIQPAGRARTDPASPPAGQPSAPRRGATRGQRFESPFQNRATENNHARLARGGESRAQDPRENSSREDFGRTPPGAGSGRLGAGQPTPAAPSVACNMAGHNCRCRGDVEVLAACAYGSRGRMARCWSDWVSTPTAPPQHPTTAAATTTAPTTTAPTTTAPTTTAPTATAPTKTDDDGTD